MLYLATSPTEQVRPYLDQRRIGLLVQPSSNHPQVGWLWALDNGCFSMRRWREDRWRTMVTRDDLPRAGCVFATVPDVVGDWRATLDRWQTFSPVVTRYPRALVAQDGLGVSDVPWDELDALFIGGSTDWKLGEDARKLAVAARERGVWVHVGRVNSSKRYRAWALDGTSPWGSWRSARTGATTSGTGSKRVNCAQLRCLRDS